MEYITALLIAIAPVQVTGERLRSPNTDPVHVASGLSDRNRACEAAFRHWWNGTIGQAQRQNMEVMYLPGDMPDELYEESGDSRPRLAPASEDVRLSNRETESLWQCTGFEEDGAGAYTFWAGFRCGPLCGTSCRFRLREAGDAWDMEQLGVLCPKS